MRILPALLLLATAVPAVPAPDEVGDELLALSADEALVRERAERVLAGRIATRDYPRLAETASGADAEVRARLARVVGSADRLLGLAALFVAEADPDLVRIGEEALAARLIGWNRDLDRLGTTGAELDDQLERLARGSYPHVVRLELGAPLGELLGRFRRRVGVPFGFTLAPQLDTRTPVRAGLESFEGDWLAALRTVAVVYGVGLEAHGLPPEEDEDEPEVAQVFLRFAPLSDVARRSGLDLVGAWFRTLAIAEDEVARRHAARNLAATGWPGALAWMEELAAARDDPAAWEGLFHAAAHGRRGPLVLQPAALARVLAEVEAALAARVPGAYTAADLLVAAYREAGCLATEGARLGDVLLAGWGEAPPAARALRLAVMRRSACGDVELLARARATAADAGAPAALRWQALAAWVDVAAVRGDRPAAPDWPEPRAQLEVLATPADVADAGRLLERAGIAPPARWSEPEALGPDPPRAVLAAVLDGWVGADRPEIAARYLVEQLRREDARLALHVLELRRRRGDVERLAALFEAARALPLERALAFELERAALVLGAVPPERFLEAFEEAERAELLDPDDYAVLGALAAWGAHPGAAEARGQLLVALRSALARGGDLLRHGGLVRALDTAVEGCWRRGDDGLARAFRLEVQRTCARHPGTGLSAALSSGWPRAPRSHRRDLDRLPDLDRVAALAGLPGSSQADPAFGR